MTRVPDGASHCFVSPRWFAGICLLGTTLTSVAAWQLQRSDGWTTLALASVAMSVLGLAGLADALTARVVIYPERLVIVSNFVRREFVRCDFIKVAWAKGCPTSLQRTDGSWLELPPVGGSAQGMANSLRAWINRQ